MDKASISQRTTKTDADADLGNYETPRSTLADRTHLIDLRRQGRILLGSTSCAAAILVDDVRALHARYVAEMQDPGFPAFARVWQASAFSLVHFAAPPRLGRRTFYHMLQSIILSHFVPIPSDKSFQVIDCADDESASLQADLQALLPRCYSNAFAVYALFMLRHSGPPFLQAVPPASVTLSTFVAAVLFSRYVKALVDCIQNGKATSQYVPSIEALRPLLDVVFVLDKMVQGGALKVTAWEGGSSSSWQTCVPASINESRWMMGTAGPDGWTRVLAINLQRDVGSVSSATLNGTQYLPPGQRHDLAETPAIESDLARSLLHTPLVRAGGLPQASQRADCYHQVVSSLPLELANLGGSPSRIADALEQLRALGTRTQTILSECLHTIPNPGVRPSAKRRRMEKPNKTVVLPRKDGDAKRSGQAHNVSGHSSADAAEQPILSPPVSNGSRYWAQTALSHPNMAPILNLFTKPRDE